MIKNWTKSTLICSVIAALIAMTGGMWAASTLLAPASLDNADLHATYLGDGRDITEFQLQDHRGDAFTNDDLKGQWTLLFFGFTHCPDVCPMTLAELSRAHDMLDDAGLGGNVQTVFVTVDPKRDTPERLEAYVTNFSDDFLGLTGSMEDIDVLARDLGIAHIRHDEDGGDDYMVDHGASVLLVNPEGRFQAVFGSPHRAREMVSDLDAILRFHGPS